MMNISSACPKEFQHADPMNIISMHPIASTGKYLNFKYLSKITSFSLKKPVTEPWDNED
jgi:hypothetical protein